MEDMKTKILDVSTIPPAMSAEQFFCSFYELPELSLSKIREYFYKTDEVTVTEVFNWPPQANIAAWKEIALCLESIQQHSPVFYVIWGPETTNAISYEIGLAQEQSEAAENKSAKQPAALKKEQHEIVNGSAEA